MKQFVMSYRPGKLIDCCIDKAICTNRVNCLKYHKITGKANLPVLYEKYY